MRPGMHRFFVSNRAFHPPPSPLLYRYPMKKSIEITKNEQVFFFSAHFMSELLDQIHIFSFRASHIIPERISLFYAAQFLRYCFKVIGLSSLPLKPSGTSFNTQNPIPHKFQKTKGFLEASMAKEC